MHLYRLRNKARYAWWMIAATLEDAIELSVQTGLAASALHVSLIGDQTAFYLDQPGGESLQALLDAGHAGVAVIEIDGALTVDVVLARLADPTAPRPAPSRRWILADGTQLVSGSSVGQEQEPPSIDPAHDRVTQRWFALFAAVDHPSDENNARLEQLFRLEQSADDTLE